MSNDVTIEQSGLNVSFPHDDMALGFVRKDGNGYCGGKGSICLFYDETLKSTTVFPLCFSDRRKKSVSFENENAFSRDNDRYMTIYCRLREMVYY